MWSLSSALPRGRRSAPMDTTPITRVRGREKQGRGRRLSMGSGIFMHRLEEDKSRLRMCDRSWEVPRVENQTPGAFQVGSAT